MAENSGGKGVQGEEIGFGRGAEGVVEVGEWTTKEVGDAGFK